VRASLRCSLDMYRFQLRLVLEKDGVVLRYRKILETLPDSIIFAHEFHDIAVSGRWIVVRRKWNDRRLYRVSMKDVLKAAKRKPKPTRRRR
jgi:hypothetical protein